MIPKKVHPWVSEHPVFGHTWYGERVSPNPHIPFLSSPSLLCIPHVYIYLKSYFFICRAKSSMPILHSHIPTVLLLTLFWLHLCSFSLRARAIYYFYHGSMFSHRVINEYKHPTLSSAVLFSFFLVFFDVIMCLWPYPCSLLWLIVSSVNALWVCLTCNIHHHLESFQV